MLELDRWLVARAAELQDEVLQAYRDYQFHLIYQKVYSFGVVDLSSFYLDVIKDGEYTTPADSAALLPDRPVPRGGSHGALARADPELHGGGGLAFPSRSAGGFRVPGHLAPDAGGGEGGHGALAAGARGARSGAAGTGEAAGGGGDRLLPGRGGGPVLRCDPGEGTRDA